MKGPKLTYFLSNEEQYLNNHYATYLKPEQKNAVVSDNNHLYFEIQQHKMNQFATRVIDSYAKKFETFNEIFRKTKIDNKKKNQPPILTSLPVYVKSVDEE